MSLPSNLEVRKCPRCGQEILATSEHCQFCRAEVAPIAIAPAPVASTQPVLKTSRAQAWQEIANTVIGVLWIISGVINLASGVLFLIAGIGLIIVGIGIIRQDWYALTIGKAASFLTAAYAFYMLVATPAFAQVGPPPVLQSIILLVAAAFQGYIFWCVSD